MKKLFVVLAVMLCLVQSAFCGPAEAKDASLEEAVQAVLVDKKDVDISFWTGTGAANLPYLQAMVDAFQKAYPNIHVDFQNQGAINDLMTKLTQNIVARQTPTLSNANPTYFREFIDSGAVVDLAPYFNNETIGYTESEKAGFIQSNLKEAESFGGEGTLYGFPTNKKTADILFYNKTFFDAHGWDAPETWDEVLEISKSIYEETGKPGFSYDVAYAESAFRLMSMQWGSEYIDENGNVAIDNEASREALKFYKDAFDAGYFSLPSEMPSSAGGNYSNKAFVEQECYMYVGAAAGAPYGIPSADKGQEVFEVGCAPLPQKDDSRKVAFNKGEDYCVFSNSTEEQRVAAWLLIKFLSSDEQNADWLIATGNLPVTVTMSSNEKYNEFLNTESDGSALYYKAQAVQAVLDMNDYITFERQSPYTAPLAKAAGTMFQSVIIGGMDIDAAIEQAVSEATW